MLSRRMLKQEAKGINRNAKVNVYAFTLLFFVIAFLMQALQDYVDHDTVFLNLQKMEAMLLDTFPSANLTFLLDKANTVLDSLHVAAAAHSLPTAAITFVVVTVWLLNCLFSAGYILYIMGIRQGKSMGYGTLFDGFAFAGKIIFLELWRTLVVTLWSCLFVLPGIIASYRYSFALYNLLDQPEMRVSEAIALSKEQTRGYKAELFLLDLSFIGWDILTSLTVGLLAIYVKPLREQSWVGYYRAITGRTPKTDEDGSDEPKNYEYHCIDDDR